MTKNSELIKDMKSREDSDPRDFPGGPGLDFTLQGRQPGFDPRQGS